MDIVKLRELLEQELSSQDLAEVGEEFYREFDSLIKALKLSAESSRERGEDIEERLYLAQLEIAERLAREIIKIRLHKIVDLAVEGIPGEMTEEERRIFTVLRAFIEREELADLNVPVSEEVSFKTAAEAPAQRTEVSKKAVPTEAYIIKIDLPKILDPELREYGPFRAGDLVIIPRSIGKVLLERDAAERVKISP
ncbi:hypothetical protein A3L11_09060 [Thermococcus siculi]|uniref:Gins51 C-terminal domain-containing protein n=1 Tax=Thermococcus siculi TaxID=72803 RepID=A0A2Z2MZC2_9EURY|nr:hypothetical protein [Thermococcus siculi]ASJ09370.1 hypothetical protein A3L11_09060 [Thermococcus siculi]